VVHDAEADKFPTNGRRSPGNGNPPASFTGFLNQTEISRAYVAADCLMLPSNHGETWGLVVNEAMASSLPCIASDKCGCAEDLIAPIHSDLRFAVGDMNAINIALARLLDHGVESRRLRSQVEKFDLSVSLETVVKLYQDVITAS
jgi:glycosyltransferase involved in cell wall biosynthesis